MEKAKQTEIPKQRRIVLVPCPYQGHITPMLQLATFLHTVAGFSITIAHTRFNSPNASNFPHFQFVYLDDGIAAQEAIPTDLIAVLLELNVNCRDSFEAEMCKLMAAEAEDSSEVIAGVIHDEIMFFCEEIASDLKLRSFILRTTSAATSLARMALVRLNDDGMDPIPKLHPLRFKDLPISLTADFTKYSRLMKKTYNMETPTTAKAIIWNTMEWLEDSIMAKIRNKSTVPIFPIGPLHRIISAQTSVLKEDFNCLSWLDEQADNVVIYVAMGSIASLNEKAFGEMAWGLANSQQPFLWVVQPGAIHGSEWIEALPKGFREAIGGRGYIVKWAPQKQVLAHRAVGGFWSHCGWNSSMESLSEGVPMLCSPCFGDQKVNARYLSYVWRVGIQLENGLEREEIEKGIRRLMVGEESKEMRERAKNFKEKIEAYVLKVEDQGYSHTYLTELVSLLCSS
ncbi:UDP-glucose iridoid glucosyltransferase-like [Cucumis melo]|uniref:UDP-glucose iridoid glucosyltransferase-like n=1 Tax=Cucumis melo TaxID=3656 RepID=A0A1S3C5L7_CUCME|nr:UDP-glucose iridoid glucosyltransferase-like [Cucumis melo]